MTGELQRATGDGPRSYPPELTLVDLWLILVRYRVIVLAVTLIFGLLGLTYAILAPERYEYVTTVQIGARLVDDEYQLIEAPDAVVAKLNKGILPLLHRELAPERAELGIAAEAGGGGVVLVQGTATLAESELYVAMLKAATARLLEAHERLFQALRSGLQAQVAQAEARVANLESQMAELARRRESLGNLERDLPSKTGGVEGGALLVYLRLTEQLDDLWQDSVNTSALLGEERASLAELQSRLTAFRPTELVSPPLRSVEPTGVSDTVVAVVATVFGLLLGILAAFFVAFTRYARSRT